MSDDKLNAALTLVRRMPTDPASSENTLAGLLVLQPDLTDDLLNNVDVPLKVMKDPADGRSFILCDFNRDGDAYRSPWSNTFYDEEDGSSLTDEELIFPRSDLRTLEIEANAIFDVYRRLYFEGGNSSVYFFETDEGNPNAFGAVFLIHKDVPESKSLRTGLWDSTHVFDARLVSGNRWRYQLTSSVMISMDIEDNAVGNVNLSGVLNRSFEQTCDLSDIEGVTHISSMGRILEMQELQMRNSIEGIYVQKTREVINGMRSPDQAKLKAWENVQKSLAAAMKAK